MYSFLGRAPEGPDGGVGAKHKNKTIFSSSFSFCHQFSFLPSCEMFLFACVLSERRGMCPVAPMMPTQEHIIYNLLVIFLSLLMSLFLYSQIRLWFWHFSFFPLLSLSLSHSLPHPDLADDLLLPFASSWIFQTVSFCVAQFIRVINAWTRTFFCLRLFFLHPYHTMIID